MHYLQTVYVHKIRNKCIKLKIKLDEYGWRRRMDILIIIITTTSAYSLGQTSRQEERRTVLRLSKGIVQNIKPFSQIIAETIYL